MRGGCAPGSMQGQETKTERVMQMAEVSEHIHVFIYIYTDIIIAILIIYILGLVRKENLALRSCSATYCVTLGR